MGKETAEAEDGLHFLLSCHYKWSLLIHTERVLLISPLPGTLAWTKSECPSMRHRMLEAEDAAVNECLPPGTQDGHIRKPIMDVDAKYIQGSRLTVAV